MVDAPEKDIQVVRKWLDGGCSSWGLPSQEIAILITALAAKDAELAAQIEVRDIYRRDFHAAISRAERAEAQLAEAIDLLGSSLCEMAPASAENHKRRVIEFIAARRAREAQGGE